MPGYKCNMDADARAIAYIWLRSLLFGRADALVTPAASSGAASPRLFRPIIPMIIGNLSCSD
jgi:hypothetical protein